MGLAKLFLRLLVLVAAATSARTATAATNQPDILLIMPDQFRGDCLSAVGHPDVRTPNLDKLARQGVLFRKAYSTVPSCIPARHSLLTGQYPWTSGIVGYAGRAIQVPTLPQTLSEAGYITVLVGRYMHQVPATESYGYQKEIRGSTYVEGDDYDKFLRAAAPETGGIRNLISSLGITANNWKAFRWPLPEELHPTAWAVKQQLEVLGQTSTEKPLFLTASFFAPHPPLFPPTNYFDYYYKQKLPAPAHGDWVDWSALTETGNKQGDRVLLKGNTLKRTLAGYFGLIEQLDNQIGALIEAFTARAEKAQRPWVILVTSDHGEMLGDHGYFRKCEPFEGAANIPMIWSGSPGLRFKPGLVSKELASLEDIMPTFLDLAGAKSSKPLDGQSLIPVLRAQRTGMRPLLHLEHSPIYNNQQAFQALTDGHMKFIWRPFDGGEYLFNLDRDPREEHDLTRDQAHNSDVIAWRQKLIHELANRPEGFTDSKKLIVGRPYPAIQKRRSGREADAEDKSGTSL